MNDNIKFRRVSVTERQIDPATVPESLQALISIAERYGLTTPIGFLEGQTQRERDTVKHLLDLYRTALIDWLDESARRGPPYPPAHSSFSALRMIADPYL
jgi:hypothetical protein